MKSKLMLIASFFLLSSGTISTNKYFVSDFQWGELKELSCLNSKMECCGEYSYNHCEMLISTKGYFFGVSNIHVNYEYNYAQFEPEIKFYNSAGRVIVDEVWTPLVRVGGTGSDPGKQVALFNKSPNTSIRSKFNQITGFSYSCRGGCNKVFKKGDDFYDGLRSSRHSLMTMYEMIDPKNHSEDSGGSIIGKVFCLDNSWYSYPKESSYGEDHRILTIKRQGGLEIRTTNNHYSPPIINTISKNKGEWLRIDLPERVNVEIKNPNNGQWCRIY